jgi:hypothetical protein
MIGVLGIVSVVAGSALAYGANWHQQKAKFFETCAGAFLILGLASLGATLPDVITKSDLSRSLHKGQQIGFFARCECERVHQR